MFVTVEDDNSRRPEGRVAVDSALDSPTDCPAVYESFLVRERLVPLVFAVRTTREVYLFNTLTQMFTESRSYPSQLEHSHHTRVTFKDQ